MPLWVRGGDERWVAIVDVGVGWRPLARRAGRRAGGKTDALAEPVNAGRVLHRRHQLHSTPAPIAVQHVDFECSLQKIGQRGPRLNS